VNVPLSKLPYIEWTDPDSGAVTRVYADAITSESANMAAVVTKHAVERGAPITDHYRKDNESVSIELYFAGSPVRGDLDSSNVGQRQNRKLKYEPNNASGAPIFTPGGLTSAVGGAISSGLSAIGLGEPGQPKTLNVLTFDAPPVLRHERFVQQVRDLQERSILVTVKTSFGPFEDLGITLASPSRQPDDGEGGRVTLTLEQMRFATSDVVTAIPLPEEPRAIPKKSGNAAGAEAADGDQSSVLKALTDKAGFTSAGSGL
jgi:hypothetical protein